MNSEPMFDINFGFKSFKDLICSIFGTWYPVIAVISGFVILILSFGISAITGHIEEWWYNPVEAILIVEAAITLDWLLGAYGAYFVHKNWSSRLAQRVVPMWMANFLLLSLFYNIVKYQVSSFGETAEVVGYTFCNAAAIYLSGVHAVSALKNAVKAGLTSAKWAKWVTDRVDKHKDKLDNLI